DDGLGTAEALALWETYNAGALRASEGLARVLVSYEELIARPRECLEKLLQELDRLGVQGLAPPEGRQLEALLASGPDRAVEMPRRLTGEEVASELTPSQEGLWRVLSTGKPGDERDRQGERWGRERVLHARSTQVA